MRKTAVLILLLLAGSPFLACVDISGGTGGRFLPPLPLHLGVLSVTNFSGLLTDGLVPAPGGGLELARTGMYDPQSDFVVANATNEQGRPGIGVQSNGSFLIVWADYRGGGMGASDIYARRYDRQGNPRGGEIAVSTAYKAQNTPSIGVYADDSFLIAWEDQRGDDQDIYAARLDSQGNRLGAEFSVCTAEMYQSDPAVAVSPTGRTIIAWSDGRMSGSQIYARIYESDGTGVGGEFPVSSGTGRQWGVKVAANSQGQFLVAYENYTSMQNSTVAIQRLDHNGNKLGLEFVMAPQTKADGFPSIAVDSKDRFVVAWQRSPDQLSMDIYAHTFEANGVRLGTEIVVTVATGTQSRPQVSFDSGDNFVVAWNDGRNGGARKELFAQRFDMNGSRLGGALVVAAMGETQSAPDVRFGPDDRMIYAYEVFNRQGDSALHARQYVHPHISNGTVTSGALSSRNLLSWGAVSSNATMWNASANNISYEFSDDGGVGWTTLPANNSLAAAGAAPTIRLRAKLVTKDERTSPHLHGILVFFTPNVAPTVSLLPDPTVWKKAPVTIAANATDGDGDSLSFEWSRLAGPEVAFNATAPDLTFTPMISGRYSFRLTVRDPWTAGPPAFVNITVQNRAPVALVVADLLAPATGRAVTFNASGSSDPDDKVAAYNFRFGDGNESGWRPEATAVHAYTAAGNYSAAVSVRDDEGNETTSPALAIAVAVSPQPRITMNSPAWNATVASRTVVVNFTVENFAISPGGQHVHFRLDSQPEVMWYSSDSYTFSNVAEGRHTIVATLQNETHAAITGPGTSATVNFTVAIEGGTGPADRTTAMVAGVAATIAIIAVAAAFLLMRRK
jgi:PKD repeat protein